MTTTQLKSLRSKVLALSEADRAQLASDLVASLDGPADTDLSKAWDVEICRRINEIEANPSLALDADEVLSLARARIQAE